MFVDGRSRPVTIRLSALPKSEKLPSVNIDGLSLSSDGFSWDKIFLRNR